MIAVAREQEVIQLMNGERAIVNDDGSVSVFSKSEQDRRHLVVNGHCPCQGFKYNGQCRHLGVAERARNIKAQRAYAASMRFQNERGLIRCVRHAYAKDRLLLAGEGGSDADCVTCKAEADAARQALPMCKQCHRRPANGFNGKCRPCASALPDD